MRRIVLGSALLLAGCSHAEKRPPEHDSARLLNPPAGAKVTNRQAADVQFSMGRSLEDSGSPNEAEAAYKKALENDPKRGDAHARLAILCDQKGDFEAASRHFAEAIRRAPKDPELLCDQGYHFYLQRRWAEAEASLNRAIALDKGHARSHTNLALVLARRGDTDAALAEFSRAGCDRSDAQANLGLVFALEGNRPEAERAYATALAAKPGSPSAREGMRALASARTREQAEASAMASRSKSDPRLLRASADLPPLP